MGQLSRVDGSGVADWGGAARRARRLNDLLPLGPLALEPLPGWSKRRETSVFGATSERLRSSTAGVSGPSPALEPRGSPCASARAPRAVSRPALPLPT